MSKQTVELSPLLQMLQESAPKCQEWAREEWASKECDKAYLGGESFEWYHSTWQYLRLLDRVAVPNWYRDFYFRAMGEVFTQKPNAKVMISAAADYGIPHIVYEVYKSVGANPDIILYDIAETPLRASRWFAERHGFEIKTEVKDIVRDDIPEGSFDLIVTDEFLSVLADEYKPTIPKRWNELLKPGGAIVTTLMLGKPTEQKDRDHYYDYAKRVIDENPHLWPASWDKDAILQKIRTFADRHTRHMAPNRGFIEDLFKDFVNLDMTPINTPGECVNPTDAFGIYARKKA